MEFYLNIEGKQRGPLDFAEFRDMVRNKTVSPEDYVWDANQSRWIKVKFHGDLAPVFEEEAALAASEDEGFFINVEGKTGGPFPRDAIIKEIERGRFKSMHFVWDGVGNRWLKAADHPLFSQFFGAAAKSASGRKYYLSKDGVRFGPFDYEDVETKIGKGEFDRNHFIWENTLKKWVKLGEIADFADLFTDLDAREPAVPPPMGETIPPPRIPGAGQPGEAAVLGADSGPPLMAATPFPPGVLPTPPVMAAPIPPVTVRPGPAAPTPGPAPQVTPPPVIPPTYAAPSAPAAAPAPAPLEPRVGELVAINIPEPAPARDLIPPPAPQTPTPAIEFRTVGAESEEAGAPASDIKVDRSLILDFVKPALVRRAAAQVVDIAFVGLFYFVVALIFSLLGMNPYMPGPEQYYHQQLFWGTLGGIAAFYILVRDAGGASIGKRVMGLRVVKLDDFNRASNLFQSIIRNITLLIPLLNILEAVYIFTDPKGRRTGDRIAGTVLTESIEIDYIRRHQSIMDEIY